ncbi:Receptor-like serine/threonine-protein kinase [Citrus sinensis]|nr:Receptor-like serine/threonine-protein kinase [Citrus sinensis]
MAIKSIRVLFFIFLSSFQLEFSDAQTWIKAGYWLAGREFPLSDINSALFTHLICAFAEVDSSTYQLSISSANQQYFSIFANSVRRKNPSIKTLLSIWNGQNSTYQSILGNKNINPSVLSSMVGDSSHRKSFIESSIRTARLYGFQGIDLFWLWPNSTDLNSLGILLDEWKASASDQPELTLSMAVRYSPTHETVSYPIDSMKKNLNWAHLVAYDYHMPSKENVTGIHAALYNPSSNISTDFGIREWLRRGFPANKLVLGLPFHGYAWTLVNPNDNDVGARASGPGITIDGSMGYKFIRAFIQNYGYGAAPVYNASYVVNLFTSGATWINFDGVETIKAKISYAKEKNLLGYKAFQLSNDDNWALSRAGNLHSILAAQIEENNDKDKQRLLLLILLPIGLVLILIASLICYFRRTAIKSKGTSTPAAEYFDSDTPNLQVFSFSDIKAATNNFSSANKLGEGGFGPVYKGNLPRGQEFAVKRLSATSTQGLEEFKNEVSLTARLQHVNLLRVLGYCTERDENMLIYEYLPNKSLDLYLFDPIRRYVLDWQKRVNIIEGVTQGLLYLQEYSNFRVIHRDLKASNILLDNELNPKISDFGMAKLFRKDVDEANTGRIVGTYGYVPPEYVKKGIYSMKYDVYSFGVLLLQIISSKRNTRYYGTSENLNFLEYAFEQWKDSKGKEFIDPSLDDSSSPCKLLNCMQVALLCVQENPEDRPSMLEVSSMLKDDSMAIAAPKRPAFSAKGDENAETSSTSRQEIYSFNDPELSQLEPR